MTTVPAAAPTPLPTATPNPLSTFTRRNLHPAVVEQCKSIFFRQSFINDYLNCPQMALYRWIINLDPAAPFLAATLGTAGHAVIYNFHTTNKFDYGYMEVLSMFEKAFLEQLAKEKLYPPLPAGCESYEEAFAIKSPEYIKLLLGYQYHPRNREFHSTMNEQAFVLELPCVDADGNNGQPYLFTGQIDQGGIYDDGITSIRDFKFKDNSFRPSKTELDLNIQMTIYATAMRYGKPVCEKCRPRQVRHQLTNKISLEYNGPCPACAAKIGTPQWPGKFVHQCEMIWMNDFDKHTKDQHDEWIINRDAEKIPNPKGKGPKVYPRMKNPDYDTGYKTGDYKGVGFMRTIRPPSTLPILMSDVLRVCDEIRKGTFYRQPGDSCNFFCQYRDACLKGLELEVKEANLEQVSAVGTDEPW